MPMCEHCGKKFSVDDARSEFDDEWAGELEYEDVAPEHSICGSCADALALENVAAGRAMQFSLETGLPPDDVPDDWSPSKD